jgi:hypothetical protein
MTPLALAQRATYFAEMPPGSKAADVETFRLSTPLSPGDRFLPCHFAALPRREIAGPDFSSWSARLLLNGAPAYSLHASIRHS